MFFQTKSKKYTYLSMCSCCNIISKYSSVVKLHLQHNHVKQSSKDGSKMVIPIRINSKYEKHLALKLHTNVSFQSRKNTKQNTTNGEDRIKTGSDQIIPKRSNKRNVSGKISILCIICKKSFSNTGGYFSHLSAKDHLNVKIYLSCTYCKSQFHSLQDLIYHNKNKHLMKRNLSVTQLDISQTTGNDVKHTGNSNLHCPYCLNIFNDIKNLYEHLGDKHCDDIVLISIKTYEDAEGVSQEQDTVVVAYKCQHCNELFNGILDNVQHVTEKHVLMRQSRKRKMPQWLQEHRESEKDQVKKSRNDSSCRNKLGFKDLPSKKESSKKNSGKKARSQKKINQNLVPRFKAKVVLQKIESYEKAEPSWKMGSSLQQTAIISDQNEQNSKINLKKDKKADSQEALTKERNQSDSVDKVLKEENFENIIVHSVENSRSLSVGNYSDSSQEAGCGDEEIEGHGGDVESTIKHPGGLAFTSRDRNKSIKDMQIDVEVVKDVNETKDCKKVEDKNEGGLKQRKTSKTEMLKCPYCKSKEYNWPSSLKRHIKAKHAEYAKVNAEDGKEEQNLLGQNKNTEREIAYDETLSADISDDELKGDSDDDYNPEEDNTSDSDIEKQKIIEPKMFKCKYCKGNEFSYRTTLHQHIKIKHPEIIVFDQLKEKRLTRRKNNDAENTTRFKCPFCAFSLYHREYVFSHIERVHSEVSHFTHADIVKKLEKIKDNHSDSECFQCPYCKYLCNWKSDLLNHCRNHHPTLKQPDHIPCILPASWVDNQSINAKLKCTVCGSFFEGKTNFEKHMKDHMSDKKMNITFHGSLPEPDSLEKKKFGKYLLSFLCTFCDCVFKRKDSFIYHMRSHKGGTQKKSETTAIKCVMLRQDPAVLSINYSGCSESSTSNSYIDLCKKENVDDNEKIKENGDGDNSNLDIDDNEKIKENGDGDNSNVDNVAFNSNSANQNSDKMSRCIEKISYCSEEHTNEPNAMEENLNIVHITSVSANKNEKYSHSRLPSGSFICPVCDEFKTFSKTVAVKHVEDSHSSKMSKIEILYILPHVYFDKYNPVKDEFVFGCDSCSFSTNSIVHAVKHIKNHRNEPEKERSETDENFKAKTVEPKLFDMVSMTSLDFGTSEDIIYKCWSCDPSYLLKTRKGYRKHMMTYHEDTIGCDVGDVMNQMLEVIDDKKGTNYRCAICNDIIKTRDDLIDHFMARHPDKVDSLMTQLNNRKIVANIQNSTDDTSCEICSQGYRDDAALRRHLLLHLNKARIHCATCGIHFKRKEEVANHSVNAHSISNFMCNICGKMYCSNKDFARHLRQHRPVKDSPGKNAKILCQHCGMELRNISSNIKRHQLRYHVNLISCECGICKKQSVPDGVTSCVCTLCKNVFCTNYMLAAHQKTEHLEQNVHRNRMYGETAEFKCVGCAMIFESHKGLQSHSHECDKGIKKLELMSQNMQHDEEQLNISEGEDKSVKKNELSASSSAELIKENFLVYNAGAELPFGCSLCQKSFKILKYMYNHVRRTHASDATRRFRCKVCKMGFVSASSLKQHCKRHIGLRLHQCMYCKKSYKSSTHLRDHIKIHTDTDTPKYTCGYCGNKYLQNGALLAHVVHHDRIQPYKCPFCRKSYTTSGDLKRHMDKYDKSIEKKELKCSYCKKTFENTHYLLKHFQTHTVKDPFSCSVCQKKFSSFRQMYRHKDKNKHFTDKENKEAREDLQTPGRMFRPRNNWNSKTKKEGLSDHKDFAHGASMIDKVAATIDQESAKFIFDNESCFEIQVPNNGSGGQDEATKSALALFQENVVQSMIDVVESEHEVEEKDDVTINNYDQGDQYQYVVEISDSQTQSGVQDFASNISSSDITFDTETVTVHGETAVQVIMRIGQI